MLNVAVPEVLLDRASIVTLIRKLVPAGVAKHMGVRWELKFRQVACALDDLPNRISGKRCTAFRHENESPTARCAIKAPERSKLSASQRVNAWNAVLSALDV